MRKSRNERSLWAAAERLKGRVVRPARYSLIEDDYHSCSISLLDSEYHFLVVYKFFRLWIEKSILWSRPHFWNTNWKFESGLWISFFNLETQNAIETLKNLNTNDENEYDIRVSFFNLETHFMIEISKKKLNL